jgi:hypothetical protein
MHRMIRSAASNTPRSIAMITNTSTITFVTSKRITAAAMIATIATIPCSVAIIGIAIRQLPPAPLWPASMLPNAVTAALLIQRSMRPKLSTAHRASAATCSSSVTSVRTRSVRQERLRAALMALNCDRLQGLRPTPGEDERSAPVGEGIGRRQPDPARRAPNNGDAIF